MGSGAGLENNDSDCAEIGEFLTEALKGLHEERIKVHEHTRTKDTGIDDHSFPQTIAYSFRLRGITVRVNVEKPGIGIIVDGVTLGPEVCVEQLAWRLRDACAERQVFQQAEREDAARQAKAGLQEATRRRTYGPLAAKLRSRRPSASRQGRKKR